MAQVILNPEHVWEWYRVGRETMPEPVLIPHGFLLDRFWDRTEITTWMEKTLKRPVFVENRGDCWSFQTHCEEDRTTLDRFFFEQPRLPSLVFHRRPDISGLMADLHGGLVSDTRSVIFMDRQIVRVLFRRVEDAALVKLRWSHLLFRE